MTEIKPFSGIMDSDNPYEKVAPQHHVMAENIVFKGEPNNLRAENVTGNRIVPNASMPIAATCPIVTGLAAVANTDSIDYYFDDYYTPLDNYLVELVNSADPTDIVRQFPTINYGTFTGVTAGNYYVRVTVSCSSDLASASVTSTTVTIAAPSCHAVASVTAYAIAHGISYYFAASVDSTTSYTIHLRSAADDSIIATQTITTTSGTFTGLADGTYYIEVIPNCTNGLTGGGVNSDDVVLTTATGATYNLTLSVDSSGSGDALLVNVLLGGSPINAPFSTHVTVSYTYTVSGGSPISDTTTVVLNAGTGTAYVFGTTGVAFTSYSITAVSPSTDGTNTYTY